MIDTIFISLGAFAPVGILAVRNVYGWLANSLKDKKIDKYEWQQLGTTVVKLGSIAVFLHLGMGWDGTSATALVAAADAARNDIFEPLLSVVKGNSA